MAVTPVDFWIAETPAPGWDKWGSAPERLDVARLNALIERPETGNSDLEVALALMDLVRDDLLLSGTSGPSKMHEDEMRTAVRALTRVSSRAGLEFKLPFRDHAGWKAWWDRNGATGSWQARRNLIANLFDASYARMLAAHDRTLDSTLASAVSPHDKLGWPAVDAEIAELRRHFREARTPQDYRSVGNDCVHLLEALSRKVYVHSTHTPDGEAEPPYPKTKLRLERYVEHRLPGSGNSELRAFARSVVNLAQGVKHDGAPSRTEAGLVADAVILLANMLRRLDDNPSDLR